MLCWLLLTRGEDYAFARPSLVRQKVRLLELAAGDARRIGYRNPVRIFATPAQNRLERELGAQATTILASEDYRMLLTRAAYVVDHLQTEMLVVGEEVLRQAERTAKVAPEYALV